MCSFCLFSSSFFKQKKTILDQFVCPLPPYPLSHHHVFLLYCIYAQKQTKDICIIYCCCILLLHCYSHLLLLLFFMPIVYLFIYCCFALAGLPHPLPFASPSPLQPHPLCHCTPTPHAPTPAHTHPFALVTTPAPPAPHLPAPYPSSSCVLPSLLFSMPSLFSSLLYYPIYHACVYVNWTVLCLLLFVPICVCGLADSGFLSQQEDRSPSPTVHLGKTLSSPLIGGGGGGISSTCTHIPSPTHRQKRPSLL